MRHVIQEPRNGGEACPALEERAGCVEYWTRQGTECQQSLSKSIEKWTLVWVSRADFYSVWRIVFRHRDVCHGPAWANWELSSSRRGLDTSFPGQCWKWCLPFTMSQKWDVTGLLCSHLYKCKSLELLVRLADLCLFKTSVSGCWTLFFFIYIYIYFFLFYELSAKSHEGAIPLKAEICLLCTGAECRQGRPPDSFWRKSLGLICSNQVFMERLSWFF